MEVGKVVSSQVHAQLRLILPRMNCLTVKNDTGIMTDGTTVISQHALRLLTPTKVELAITEPVTYWTAPLLRLTLNVFASARAHDHRAFDVSALFACKMRTLNSRKYNALDSQVACTSPAHGVRGKRHSFVGLRARWTEVKENERKTKLEAPLIHITRNGVSVEPVGLGNGRVRPRAPGCTDHSRRRGQPLHKHLRWRRRSWRAM